MNRVTCLALAMLSITAALPAAAQDSGGLRLRNNPLATLDLIDANRGCPLSSTSVTVGVNTQVAVGANLALGSASQAGQSINVQGQRGALATIDFTRGANIGAGAGSIAAQRIQNLTTR